MSSGAKSQPDRLHASFETSAPDLRRCPPEGQAEIAFAGRSNAGKSSVLNMVTGSRRMAKVSKTPGRTQLLNFFAVQGGGYLVDLPGYGYAKAGRAAQGTWQAAVNDYLSHRASLVGLVLVMDIRHPNQEFDQELLDWSAASELATHVLLNKADKLSYSKQQQVLHKLLAAYKTHPSLSVQTCSTLKGQGKDMLLETLSSWLSRGLPAP